MLVLLVAHIIITFCCLWSGYLFHKIIFRNNSTSSIIHLLISGLIALTLIAQIVVLFLPIDLKIQLFVIAVILISFLIKWNDGKRLIKEILSEVVTWQYTSIILFITLWILVLLMNSGPVIMDDTESYHIQMIKWIQEYGTVPGLVNLHERFGFNSSWFSSAALFSFLPGTTGGFTVLNGVVSAWLIFWILSKHNKAISEANYPVSSALIFLLGSCLIAWPLIRGNAASANYDFITTAIVLILSIELFLNKHKKITPQLEWIVWPVYLLTIRIINFPALLLSFSAVIIFIRERRLKTVVLPAITSLALIIPFLIRNTIISGYPFYPSTFFDWKNADWKPDPVHTGQLLEYIKYYNRVPTTYLELEQTRALGVNWIPSWFQYQFLYDKILIIAGIAGILLTLILLIRKRASLKQSTLLVIVFISWLISWLLISPAPRFIYGVLLSGIFLLLAHLFSMLKNLKILNPVSKLFLLILIAGTFFYIIAKPIKQNEYRNWIIPVQLPRPLTKQIIIDGVRFNIPEPINNNWNSRCYGTELPCLYKVDPRLRVRGKNIRSGFRLEK